MTEKKFNPMKKENRLEGPETNFVTINAIKVETFEHPSFSKPSNRVAITWLEDGKDKEWTEDFSIGAMIPTKDGKGFTKKDGTHGQLGSNTNFALLYDLLDEGGYDVDQLFDEDTGIPDVTPLIGGRFQIHNVQKKDLEGTLKYRTFEGKDGDTRYVTEIVAQSVGISLRWSVVAGVEKASEALATA